MKGGCWRLGGWHGLASLINASITRLCVLTTILPLTRHVGPRSVSFKSCCACMTEEYMELQCTRTGVIVGKRD